MVERPAEARRPEVRRQGPPVEVEVVDRAVRERVREVRGDVRLRGPQNDVNVRVFDGFDTISCTIRQELNERKRLVQKLAKSTSI